VKTIVSASGFASAYSESLSITRRQDQRISIAEIQNAFDRQGVPPILSLEEAAQIIRLPTVAGMQAKHSEAGPQASPHGDYSSGARFACFRYAQRRF